VKDIQVNIFRDVYNKYSQLLGQIHLLGQGQILGQPCP